MIYLQIKSELLKVKIERKLNYAQMGAIFNMSGAQIQKYVKGETQIPFSFLFRFCYFFEIDPAYFFPVDPLKPSTTKELIEDLNNN